jgi:hypothetical protein
MALLLLKMVLLLLLSKGAEKYAMLLLKRVLLQLPKMACPGTAEAAKKAWLLLKMVLLQLRCHKRLLAKALLQLLKKALLLL